MRIREAEVAVDQPPARGADLGAENQVFREVNPRGLDMAGSLLARRHE